MYSGFILELRGVSDSLWVFCSVSSIFGLLGMLDLLVRDILPMDDRLSGSLEVLIFVVGGYCWECLEDS